jgi:hypothetical protein
MNTGTQGATFKKERWFAYFFCLLALCVITVLEVFFYYRDNIQVLLYILSCIAIGGGAYGWVYYDAKERGIRFTKNMKTTVGLFGPIAIPVYFVRSRGFKVAAKTGFGLALYVPFYAFYYGVWIVTGDFLKAIGYFS